MAVAVEMEWHVNPGHSSMVHGALASSTQQLLADASC
jgi:hypothetical protein